LNIAFHALAGLAIGQAAACRVPPPEARDPGDRRHAALVTAIAFVLAVMSHGVLDGLPHEYPFRWLGDTLATAALVVPWMWLVQRPYRRLMLIVLIGTVLPDVIDHVPRDLNRHLGTHLPELTKIFPWHGRGGSGSLSGDVPFRAHVASIANHVIVVSFSAVVLWLTRRVLRHPR